MIIRGVEKTRIFSKSDIKCICIFIGLMFFSMYFPYNHNIAIVYQIVSLFLGVWWCKDNSSGITFILLLNVTREYIAISTMDSFVNYYSLNSYILLVFIFLLVGIKLYHKKWKMKLSMIQIPLMLLGFQMLMSQLWASNLDEYNTYFPIVCVIYILGFLMIDTESANRIIKVSFVFAGFFMAIGVIPYYLSHGSLEKLTVLINGNGLLVDRNYQSLFLMMCILNSVLFLKEYSMQIGLFSKLLVSTIIFADIFIIVVGASRSAILGLVVAILVYILVNSKSIGSNIKIIGVALILLFFAYDTGLLEPVISRFAESDVSSGNGRFSLWTKYFSEYEQGNPIQVIVGRGLIGKSIIGAPAHNLFVSILFSFGMFGFAAFLLYYGSVFIRALRICPDELIIIIPLLFMSCTLEPYYRIEFALYTACIPVILQARRREKKNE